MINKYSAIPIYSQLKQIILKKIETGEFPENSKIPSEQEFCEMYDISRPTVRQAIAELTNSGVLYKEKGKGTFVAKSRTNVDVREYSGFTDSILDSQEPGNKNILSINIVDGRDIPNHCGLFGSAFNQNQEFYAITYITMKENDVLSLNVSYLPASFFPNIEEDIKNKKPSYDILRGKYPLIPVKSKSVLEVIYTDQEDARYLKVQPGQPLIRIDNILYSKSGQAVEYIVSKYRADKCRLVFENAK